MQPVANRDEWPLLPANRQVHVSTQIYLSVLDGPERYLAYDEKTGEKGITHRAYISEGQK